MQLASGFLVEVGNAQQDKFLFDLGTGAFINLWATGVPLATVTKVSLIVCLLCSQVCQAAQSRELVRDKQ